MACGVTCVATDVGDSAYIVGNTGKIVQPGDMKGLAEAIIKISEMPTNERIDIGSKARMHISEKFEISTVVKCYEELYQILKNQSQ